MSRFISDLLPEATLLGESNNQRRDVNDIGAWHDGGARHSSQERDPDDASEDEEGQPTPSTTLERYSSTEHLLPPESDQRSLMGIYFARIHPLLPLLNQEAFEHGSGSSMVALRQAVCLAASRDPAASSSLQLREISHILAPKEFARILRSELVSLLQSGCSRDRASRIRALALLSLYAEGDEGAEEASLCLAQAIHLAHTVGIHLGRAHADRQSKDLDNLFWSLWSLDKLNAAMHGRPQMMNERDVGLKLEDAYKSNEPAFCIWLKLSELLAKVVRLYSPTAGPEDTEWADSLVSFEEVVEEHQGWGVEPDLLSRFYQAATHRRLTDMLSKRPWRFTTTP